MKFSAALVILLAAVSLAPAQTNDVDYGGLLDAAQAWVQDNLDTNVATAILQNVDREQVEDFLKHYQDYLQGDYVLDLAQLKSVMGYTQAPTLLLFGLVFMVVGIGFKLGVAPFYMWIPDDYQGAPTPITTFIASATGGTYKSPPVAMALGDQGWFAKASV